MTKKMKNKYICKYGQGLWAVEEAATKEEAIALLRQHGIPAGVKNTERVRVVRGWRTKKLS